jgi:DNA-binding NarL/FixJ family response regulator
MEPMDGLDASRRITATHPEARIVMLTNYDGDLYRRTAEQAGVRGFVLKENLHEIRELVLPR